MTKRRSFLMGGPIREEDVQEARGVKKTAVRLLMAAVLGMFVIGCGQYAINEADLKCPKCGAMFTVDEGLRGLWQ